MIRQPAERFGNYLVDRAELLADFPELGTSYRKRANVRRLLCKSYYLYYRLQRKEQTIELWITGTPLVVNHCYETESATERCEEIADVCLARGTRVWSGRAQTPLGKSQARATYGCLVKRQNR